MTTSSKTLEKIVLKTLKDNKALNTVCIKLGKTSNVADSIIITTGTSTRHVNTLKDKVSREAKNIGANVLGSEGEKEANWIVLDLESIVVHFFRQEVREYYNIEKIWEIDAENPTAMPTESTDESAD